MVSIEADSVMNDLFYPKQEVINSYQQLHDKPAPAGHPVVNGENISASHPLAMNAFNFGAFIRSPRIENDLVINDLVIDIEVANKSDEGKKIVENIKKGESIGVSTGLNASVVNKCGTAKGREYKRAVQNIQFDHVAVLLSEPPAGQKTFTINSETGEEQLFICNLSEDDKPKTTPKGEDMDKEKIVLALIGNSQNDFTSADKDNLMSMSEVDLVNAIHSKVKAPETTLENAQKVIKDNGLMVTNADNKEMLDQVLVNKDEFALFLENKKKEKQKVIDEILANSKIKKETLESMSDAGLKEIHESLSPVGDYSGRGDQIVNQDRSGEELKTDYSTH